MSADLRSGGGERARRGAHPRAGTPGSTARTSSAGPRTTRATAARRWSRSPTAAASRSASRPGRRGRASRCACSAARGRAAARRSGRRSSSERLDAALARRRALGLDRDAYRVVHAESDGLPGLVVDRYADAAVIQTTSVAMNAARAAIAELVRDAASTRASSSRATTARRATSRSCRASPAVLPATARRASSTAWARTGSRPTCSPTGRPAASSTRPTTTRRVAALARAGRARARRLHLPRRLRAGARPRRAAARCSRSTRARPPSRAPTANARRNELANMTVERANAFDLLRALEARGERFDVVVIDPPALAKRGGAAALATAARAYKELRPARRAPHPPGRPARRLLVLGPRHARALGGDLRRRARRRGPRRARALARRRRPRSPRARRRPRDGAPQGLDLPNPVAVVTLEIMEGWRSGNGWRGGAAGLAAWRSSGCSRLGYHATSLAELDRPWLAPSSALAGLGPATMAGDARRRHLAARRDGAAVGLAVRDGGRRDAVARLAELRVRLRRS